MCPLKKKLIAVAKACNITQTITLPTRTTVNKNGLKTSTCIDHLFTNVPGKCTKPVSIPVGFSDHNLIAIKRKTKVPKAPSLIIHKRSYKHFNQELFLDDVKRVNWSNVCREEDPEVALSCFMSLFLQIADKHAPVRKTTVRANGAPWIGNELKSLMKQRDQAKKLSDLSGLVSDKLIYCKLRNHVTKINRVSKKEYYKNKINDSKNNGKQLWKILNQIMGRSSHHTNSFIEINGAFLTKPVDIANYFNNYFTNKFENLRVQMTPSDVSFSCTLIENCIAKPIL